MIYSCLGGVNEGVTRLRILDLADLTMIGYRYLRGCFPTRRGGVIYPTGAVQDYPTSLIPLLVVLGMNLGAVECGVTPIRRRGHLASDWV